MSSVVNRKHQNEVYNDNGDEMDGASVKSKVTLRDLFNYGRWKRPFGLKHFLFCLYLPIGLVLWPLRLGIFALMFLSMLILPRSLAVKMRGLANIPMGIRTKIFGKENIPSRKNPNSARIIVCNHLSDFDPYPICSLIPDFHTLVAAHIRKVPVVGKVYEKFSTIYVDPSNKGKARDDVLESLSKTDKPLLIYPEGGLTNGKKGIMMFHKFVFGLGHSVTPVAMRINNPWPVEVDYLGSSWFKNFFWWMLVPYHNFELTFLSKQTIQPGESDSDFAMRIQTIIANHLNIEATTLTYSQKKEFFSTGKYKQFQ
ncbi:hypothetical protein DLAC_05829 [Tieghemostelium lacteum]|uniref:Phospholipid/glycerol acyltransferase domain-containing protein n=1 Tax=Tieghemostelium lacteum TaxID=361077 RepID=A0A151ZGU1_TIELA|nr:hypothetical protein DLAC_05829 [Tieghemostelium lacteum]|eukprot:KYQ93191.1 hypothetical protein DLAC_05829 [Tieghemostelium lacteum]